MPRTKSTTTKKPAPVITAKEFKVSQQGEEVTFDAPNPDQMSIQTFSETREGKAYALKPTPDSPLLPELTIVIVTFKRFAEIKKTIDALLKYLQYPREKLHWLIADDSSGDEYIANLRRAGRDRGLDLQFSVTDANCGWGCNVNLALEKVETELIFFLEDDTILTQPLDLRVGVALLQVKPEIGMLRYRGTAGDHVVLHQLEADIKDYLPAYQDGTGLQGRLTYCLIDSGSPTAYVYSNGSHLKRKSFHAPENYGLYPEGKKLGHTEESFAITTKERMHLPNAPAIAILPDYIKNVWDYVGTSWQLTGFDKGV